MSRGTRFGLLGVAVVIAVVAIVIATSGGDDNDNNGTTGKGATSSGETVGTTNTSTTGGTAAPKPLTITVTNGKPVGGIQKIELKKGARVRFTVSSDVADEIHVHGYDFHKDVEAGGKVSFDFPATISGGFEIELENRKEQIAELTVKP
jgi:hypothetical protein